MFPDNDQPKRIGVRVCVVLCAGGSAFEAAFKISGWSPDAFLVVTDRDCPASERAAALGIECVQLPQMGKADLSRAISDTARAANCSVILLHFDRLVSAELYDAFLTFNVHPSLLPAFPGPDGVAAAAKAGSLYQGATLHIVDAGVDTGPVISQTVCQVPLDCGLDWRYRLSYVQKTAVTLSLLDLLGAGRIDWSKRGTNAVKFAGLSSGAIVHPDYLTASFSYEIRNLLASMGAAAGFVA